mmetsp:Transcript_8796/g.21770  ORF Transcript_8796/g.21770 Transcript_8796/m.21770 type:complete len:170 (-) Transcript_8796:157-666(-)
MKLALALAVLLLHLASIATGLRGLRFLNLPNIFGSGQQNVTRPSGKPPLIYVYNVTERFRTSREAWQWQHTSLYGLEMTFPVQLFNSPYVTNDPNEADYFYVHAWLYHSTFREVPALIKELKAAGAQPGQGPHLFADPRPRAVRVERVPHVPQALDHHGALGQGLWCVL